MKPATPRARPLRSGVVCLMGASVLVSLLVDIGADAISANPEAIPSVMGWIAKAEEGRDNQGS
jgi:hypothetical protein